MPKIVAQYQMINGVAVPLPLGGEGGAAPGIVDRVSALEDRFDADGMLLAKNMPLTDAVDSATGKLAASDTAVKTAYDKAAATAGLWIGVPRPWRGTTLPPNYCWANGDFVAFADWPELKAVYEAGGFAGLLMAWDANGKTQAANLGQWRPDAAEPTGLFTPNLTGQFLRCWGPGAEENAGAWHRDEIRNITGSFGSAVSRTATSVEITPPSGAIVKDNALAFNVINDTRRACASGFDASLVVPTGQKNVPQHVLLPCIIYLGQPAAN